MTTRTAAGDTEWLFAKRSTSSSSVSATCPPFIPMISNSLPTLPALKHYLEMAQALDKNRK